MSILLQISYALYTLESSLEVGMKLQEKQNKTKQQQQQTVTKTKTKQIRINEVDQNIL